MPNPAYVKVDRQIWLDAGIRAAEPVDFSNLGVDSQCKIEEILDGMDWQQLMVFRYDGSDRIAAPFIVGVSSEGNPLMRGYQIEGGARSGKKQGWKVWQVGKMENLEIAWDFFEADDFVLDPSYPWIYKVFKMLEGG